MTQPTLPAEVTYTDLEASFIRNSPPGLWPDNQNSNFGQVRRVVTDQLQGRADELAMFYLEMFPLSASNYLAQWEEMLGLPVAPTGKTVAERRAYIITRRRYGAFTRSARRMLIEDLLSATFGQPLELTPDGLALDAGGLALQGETLTLEQLYRVYEDVMNFSYSVRISNANAIDTARLTQSLARMSPAGADTFTIVNTNPQILHYREMTIDRNPVFYSKMSGSPVADNSGFAHAVTTNSAPVVVAAPGLVNAALLGTDDARDLDGVDDYYTVADAPLLDQVDNFTLRAIVNLDSSSNDYWLFDKGTNAYGLILWCAAAGQWRAQLRQSGNATPIADTTLTLVPATTYHIVAVKDSTGGRVYVNGVDVTNYGTDTNPALSATATALHIGRSSASATGFLNGRLDEPAIFDRPWTAAQVLSDYRTSVGLV